MAIRTLLWAKDQTVITQTIRRKSGQLVESPPTPNVLDKMVLIGIGDEASEKTWDALIGVEDLAVFACCTRRAVQESLRRLERAGFIRCRETRVESGRSGWQRIYLLSEESPLAKGMITVDFDTVEKISRFQMRTFRDRGEAGYLPSDSLTRRKKKNPGQGGGEPGSHSPLGVNQVRTTGANLVRTEGEPGSHYEGEPGSHPSFSTNSSSPSDARARAEQTTEGETEAPAGPTSWAAQLISGLDYGRYRRPTQVQADDLARLVDAARALGLTEVEIKRHCRATLNAARTSGVSYLAGGLQPDNLPIPTRKNEDQPGKADVIQLRPKHSGEMTAEDLIARGLDPKLLPKRLRDQSAQA